MKKAVSLIICVIMCVSVFILSTPVAFAASYNGTCGSNVRWALNTGSGVLTISGFGNMSDYSLNTAPGWDRYQSYVKYVVFEDGVTSAGAYSFYNGGNGAKYKKLVSVDFGSVANIKDYAFRGCASLSSFSGCDSVSRIGNQAFRGCTGITEFPFSHAEETGNGSFCGCTSITTLSVPDTLSLIGSEAFEGCTGIESLTLSSGVASAGNRAFADCTGITEIIFDSEYLNTVGEGVFENSGAAEGITLTVGDAVSAIPEKIFSYCRSLTTVEGCSSVSTIGAEAFAHTGLTDFFVTESVISIDYSAFADCMSLTAFTVDEDNEEFSATPAGILMNKSGIQLIRYPGGKTDISYTVPSSVTSLAEGAFRECRYLERFNSGSGITQISTKCFANSPALETVSLSTKVTMVKDYAFINCPSLTTVSMPNVSTVDSHAFAECRSLGSLTTSAKLRTIGTFAFYNCDGLASVNITSGTTTIGTYAFYNCDGITTLSVGSTVTKICEGAFSYCTLLNSVSLSEGLTTVEKNAFLNCSSLTEITIPSTVKSIGANAFGFEYGSPMKKKDNFVIHCYSGSAGSTYATNNFITSDFVTNSAGDAETIVIGPAEADTADTQSAFDFDSVISMIDGLFESLLGSTVYEYIKQIVTVIFDILAI